MTDGIYPLPSIDEIAAFATEPFIGQEQAERDLRGLLQIWNDSATIRPVQLKLWPPRLIRFPASPYIAILDGPAGSGRSTLARRAARDFRPILWLDWAGHPLTSGSQACDAHAVLTALAASFEQSGIAITRYRQAESARRAILERIAQALATQLPAGQSWATLRRYTARGLLAFIRAGTPGPPPLEDGGDEVDLVLDGNEADLSERRERATWWLRRVLGGRAAETAMRGSDLLSSALAADLRAGAAGGPLFVVLDHCELLDTAAEAIRAVIAESSQRSFWLLIGNTPAWQHLPALIEPSRLRVCLLGPLDRQQSRECATQIAEQQLAEGQQPRRPSERETDAIFALAQGAPIETHLATMLWLRRQPFPTPDASLLQAFLDACLPVGDSGRLVLDALALLRRPTLGNLACYGSGILPDPDSTARRLTRDYPFLFAAPDRLRSSFHRRLRDLLRADQPYTATDLACLNQTALEYLAQQEQSEAIQLDTINHLFWHDRDLAWLHLLPLYTAGLSGVAGYETARTCAQLTAEFEPMLDLDGRLYARLLHDGLKGDWENDALSALDTLENLFEAQADTFEDAAAAHIRAGLAWRRAICLIKTMRYDEAAGALAQMLIWDGSRRQAADRVLAMLEHRLTSARLRQLV